MEHEWSELRDKPCMFFKIEAIGLTLISVKMMDYVMIKWWIMLGNDVGMKDNELGVIANENWKNGLTARRPPRWWKPKSFDRRVGGI